MQAKISDTPCNLRVLSVNINEQDRTSAKTSDSIPQRRRIPVHVHFRCDREHELTTFVDTAVDPNDTLYQRHQAFRAGREDLG